MILRARPKAVKRQESGNHALPNKRSVCLPLLSTEWAKALQRSMAALHVRTQTVVSFHTIRAKESTRTMRLTVNGSNNEVDAAPDTALLYVLRNDLELNGPKYGCGLGECGACTVLIDGVAARSCVILVGGCGQRDIVTLEGLGSRQDPDPVQAAFIAEQATQCGYCLNGMIMTTKALLLRNPHPTADEIRETLRYNLCRCGAHVEILRAALRAAGHAVEAHT
jgi:nicotinate dehydrogenase subunit A